MAIASALLLAGNAWADGYTPIRADPCDVLPLGSPCFMHGVRGECVTGAWRSKPTRDPVAAPFCKTGPSKEAGLEEDGTPMPSLESHPETSPEGGALRAPPGPTLDGVPPALTDASPAPSQSAPSVARGGACAIVAPGGRSDEEAASPWMVAILAVGLLRLARSSEHVGRVR
jgi:hypothetical protein